MKWRASGGTFQWFWKCYPGGQYTNSHRFYAMNAEDIASMAPLDESDSVVVVRHSETVVHYLSEDGFCARSFEPEVRSNFECQVEI